MKKIVIRAIGDLGTYLFACLSPAITQLGFEPVRIPAPGDNSLFPVGDVKEEVYWKYELDLLHQFH